MNRHLRVASTLAIIGFLSVPSAAPAADEVNAAALVAKAIEALPKASFAAAVTLSTGEGAPRTMALKQKYMNGTRGGYMEVTGPADLAGIRHLFLEPREGRPKQFLKMTASRSLVMVAEETREQPFLRSNFYVADLVEPPVDAYDYSYAGDTKIGDRNCKLVQSVAKNPKKEVYSKIIVAIDPQDLVALRREFFDKDGKLLKTLTVDKLEKIDGNWTPMLQTMKNAQDNSVSTLEVTSIKYGVDIEDSVFTPEYLRRD